MNKDDDPGQTAKEEEGIFHTRKRFMILFL